MDEFVAAWIETHRYNVRARDVVQAKLLNAGLSGAVSMTIADELIAEGSGVVIIPEADLEAL